MKKLNSILAHGGLCEEFNGPQGGGAALEEKDFQDKVLKGMDQTKNQVDTLVKNYDQLDGKTKEAFEDLTKQKNAFDGLHSSFTAVEQAFKKLQVKLSGEQRQAFGSPIQRIVQDEEKNLLVTAMVRKAIKAPLSESHNAVLKTLTPGASPGSTMINDTLSADIYSTLAQYGVWNTFDVRQVSSLNNKFLVKTGRPVANFLAPGAASSDDANKAGSSVTAEAKTIRVLLTVANELLQDSEVNLTQDILNDFIQAVSYRLDFACLQADGTDDATNGGMTGIFAGGTAAVAGTSNTTVESLDFEDITKCMLLVDEGVLDQEASWWMHPRQLVRMLSIKDGNGRPIFLTATEAPTPGGLGSICGAPVRRAFAAPTANSASSKIAVYGANAGQVVGLRQGFTFDSSDEFKFDELETAYRGVARAGNAVRDPGAFAVLTTAS
jgi:HK97 family phage major capsid protein|tara:strand:+ start:2614 stop:3924 length:1311 start_codon:yes stop_codon:yes gene_type:complete